MQYLDEQLLLFIQEELRNDILTPIMQLVTYLGDKGAGWIVVGLVLLALKSTRARGVAYAMAFAMTALVNNVIIKPIVMRPRPYSTMETLVVLTEKLDSYSFPSGHASTSFACAMALTLLFGKKGAWSFIPAILIAFSRPYLGMHYVSDVVCGAAFGSLCAWAAVCIWKKIADKRGKTVVK